MASRIPIAQLIDTSTFGTDGRPGLQYRRIYGARVALEWVARRWLVPRDGLPWQFGVGLDLFGLLNATPTRAQLGLWKQAFDAEGSRGEYVVGVESTLTLDDSHVLHYAPRVTLVGEGIYPLVVTIDQAADVLFQFPIL